MNKLVTRHSTLVTAALVAAVAATSAAARTVSVTAIKDGLATAAFGDADGAAYTLAWGYGPADGGAATNAWAHFETLGEVAADATAATYPLPAGWGDTITHLRFFLLEPEIPAEATRVEYLESSGTQWIDTGVNLYSNDTVVAEYEYPNPIVGKNNYLFGVYKQGMTAGYFDSNSGSCPLRFQKTNGSASANTETGINATPGARQTVTMRIASDATSTVVSDSGEALFSGGLSGTILQDATAPLALFTVNISGSPSTQYTSAAKIYSFRIYDKDNALRLDFVPCTDGNGNPAMYDRVSGYYFHNGGTGSFSTGATMATPLLAIASSATVSTADYGEPDAYLDYVEATGAQYIDSECYLASNSVIVAEYAFSNPSAKTSDYLFGLFRCGMTASFFYSSGTNKFWKANEGSSASTTSTELSPVQGARQTVTMRLGSGTSTVVSAFGETLYSCVLSGTISQNATRPLFIFALNNQGSFDTRYTSAAKIHSFRIYDGEGNLVRHFLPCLKNNIAGLYDKVTGRIFRSATATALVAGPVLPRPTELVKWVQSDGADGSRGLYIDTGIPAKAGTGMTAELLWPVKPSAASTVCGAMADSTHHFTLYTSAGTHQIGYANYSAFQVNTGTSVVYAGKRYRVTSSLAAKAQNIQVEDLDGTGYNGSRSFNDANSIDAGHNLYLFARNDAGTPNQLAKVRLYSLVLTNELGVARDFIPCVADNGRAGLYDRFSERVFFPQAAKAGATSGDFDFATEVGAATNTIGVISGAPVARLSYVESDGTSDFVNLGVIGKDGVKMVADVEWTTIPDDDVLCGARTGNSRFMLYNSYNNLHSYCYANGAPTVGTAGAPALGKRYRVTTVLDAGSQSCSVQTLSDGSWSEAKTRDDVNAAGPVDTGLPLYLFARNMDGTADAFSGARVYSFKLWQKDGNGDYQLVRDLVPAKTAGGAIGLYDRVTAGWLFNSGDRYGLSGGSESTWIDGFWIRFW